MKNLPFHHDEQGSAILIVLGILTLVLVLALVFVATSRNARTVAMANADNVQAALLAESAAARAESFNYYLQEQSIDFLPVNSSVSDLEYHWMPYAGNFQHDTNVAYAPVAGNDDNPLPLRIQHLRGWQAADGDNKDKNQYIFYTHDSNNRDGDDNRPYELLKSTNYGKYLEASSYNYRQHILGNGSYPWARLTYRNILDAAQTGPNGCPIATGRYAFLMLAEGAKLNVNQMAMAKDGPNDNYVPSVVGGVATPNASNPGTNFNTAEKSTFAIAGYEYDSAGKITGLKDSGEYVEAETVQYGLHPQELRVSEDVIDLADKLELDNADLPPQWFNYDSLLAENYDLWTTGNQQLRDFYSLYTLYSGTDDREVVFHGTEDDRSTKNYCSNNSPKVNLAYLGKPGGTRYKWEELSEAMASDPTFLSSNFEAVFGKALDTDAGSTLFKNNDGNDVTPAVFANMVDFCDADDAVTHDATVNATTRLEFGTTIGQNDSVTVNFCGNEKAPAVIGAGLEVTDYVWKATKVNNNPPNWQIQSNGTISYHVRVVLQNYFNEELPIPKKVRVLIRGKLNPWFAGYLDEAGVRHYYLFTRNQGIVDTWDGSYNSFADDGHAVNQALESTAVDFMIEQELTFDPDTDTLAAREVDDTSLDFTGTWTFPAGELLQRTVTCNLQHSGMWIQINNILVMTAKEFENPETHVSEMQMTDLAYAGGANHRVLWRIKNKQELTYNYRPIAWTIAQDPRCNHKDWLWFDFLERKGFKWDGQNYEWSNCDDTPGLSTGNALNIAKLKRLALTLIEKTCKNATFATGNESGNEIGENAQSPSQRTFAAKDLEPELNFTTGLTDAPGNIQTQHTFSTAFIPNHPFTSLWQLGAVHRGVPAQTVNLKKYGGPRGGQKYADGDAWLLDYFKLNEVAPEKAIAGKFNPNCFNALSYRYLMANIPANPDPNDTAVYQPGRLDLSDIKRNNFFYDWIVGNPGDQIVKLDEELFRFPKCMDFEQTATDATIGPNQAAAQSWSPVEAFYNFVYLRNTPKYKEATVQSDETLSAWSGQIGANDRLAESLIGCTAGLLSTRYEYFTVFAIGQNLKYIGQRKDSSHGDDYLPLDPVKPEAGYVSGHSGKDFYKQLINPIKLKTTSDATSEGWYSVLATQMRLLTIERDCWFNNFKVVRTQLY